MTPVYVLVTFLALYNAGHLALRAWGLHVGWTRGLGVASALGTLRIQNLFDWRGGNARGGEHLADLEKAHA